MGANETAGFDPIFSLHHCFVDYVFWTYQRKHNLTVKGSLSVMYDYAGTITDDQGSPVGLPPGSLLDMKTPLAPFCHPTEDRYFNSHDLTKIEEIGGGYDYTYGPGSLDPYVKPDRSFLSAEPPPGPIALWKRVRGINRAAIEGSFVIRTYAISPDGQKGVEIGREAVVSRLNVRGCKNCQTHVEALSHVPLYQSVVEYLTRGQQGELGFEVRVQTHNGYLDKVPLGLGKSSRVGRPVLEDFPAPDSIVRTTIPRYTRTNAKGGRVNQGYRL